MKARENTSPRLTFPYDWLYRLCKGKKAQKLIRLLTSKVLYRGASFNLFSNGSVRLIQETISPGGGDVRWEFWRSKTITRVAYFVTFFSFQATLLPGDLLAVLDSSVRRIQDFLLQDKLNIMDEYFIQYRTILQLMTQSIPYRVSIKSSMFPEELCCTNIFVLW